MHTQRLHENYAQDVVADLDEGRELSVEDRLADLNLTDEQIAGATAILAEEVERVAMHRTAAALHRIFAQLAAHSTQGAAFARALGFVDQSLDEISERLGVSKQAIGNCVERVRGALGPLAVPKQTAKEIEFPPAPAGEVWLTIPQARRLTKLPAGALTVAAQSGLIRWAQVGKRQFMEEADLLRWQGEVEIERAEARLTNPPMAEWKQQHSLRSSASREPLACSA